jgi:hypothetical protein
MADTLARTDGRVLVLHLRPARVARDPVVVGELRDPLVAGGARCRYRAPWGAWSPTYAAPGRAAATRARRMRRGRRRSPVVETTAVSSSRNDVGHIRSVAAAGVLKASVAPDRADPALLLDRRPGAT